MARTASLLLLVCFVGALEGSEAVISAPEVEVRSGPTSKLYVTGKLYRGDRVQVVGEPTNGFLKIEPPAGDVSLILKSSVTASPASTAVPRTGTVTAERAETRAVGLAGEQNVRGAWIPVGTQLTILDEVFVTTGQNSVAYYKVIPPKGEFRYIPADAVEKPGIIQTGGAGPGGSAASNSDVLAMVRYADACFDKAQINGDWSEARRCYEQLAKSSDNDIRLKALSRLEYIPDKPARQA